LKQLQRATSLLFRADLFSLTGLDELGYHVARTVVDEFGQLDCGVMLVDRSRGQLIRLARAGEYEVEARSPLYIQGNGVVPEAVRSGKVIYAPDVREDSRYITSDARTRSELVIPLISVKGVIGVLDLQSTQLDAFGEQDRRVLQAFAEQASAAME